jgi:hypothetical protein
MAGTLGIGSPEAVGAGPVGGASVPVDPEPVGLRLGPGTHAAIPAAAALSTEPARNCRREISGEVKSI